MSNHRIPVWLKLAYTAFLCVLVPFYWDAYGPTNFLYFCDVALFLTLAAVWLESPLLAGIPAVGILIPQMLWVADFVGGLVGWHITGMTAYMFRESIPLFARSLSLFHGWLPFFLLYLVWRLGYDRRSLIAWVLIAWILIIICYVWMPAPPAPEDNPNVPVNINYVYGPSDKGPQTIMNERLWVAFIMVAFPLVFYVPAHFVLIGMDRWARKSNEANKAEPKPEMAS